MKNYEKMVIIIIILFIISKIGAFFFDFQIAKIFFKEYSEVSNYSKLISIIDNFFKLLINIGISVWLFANAKKDRTSPWLWALFGFFFGISSIILYYVIRIFEDLNQRRRLG